MKVHPDTTYASRYGSECERTISKPITRRSSLPFPVPFNTSQFLVAKQNRIDERAIAILNSCFKICPKPKTDELSLIAGCCELPLKTVRQWVSQLNSYFSPFY